MGGKVITLREALEDLLREEGITLDDLLDAMDEDPRGIAESLMARVELSEEDVRRLEEAYSPRELNLIVFVLQAFYLSVPSGIYKGMLVYPTREEVVGPSGKVTRRGLALVIRSLGLRPWHVPG